MGARQGGALHAWSQLHGIVLVERFVKDGLVTWETQAVDYPSTGGEMPEYEPRGCPRGASFSWYMYSPLRLKYPYVRGSLLRMFLEARARLGDPVEAWAEIVDDPERVRLYQRQRGKGGFVRASWDQAFGDQTDVPQSGDWWNAGYLLIWGRTCRRPAPRMRTS